MGLKYCNTSEKERNIKIKKVYSSVTLMYGVVTFSQF